MDIKKITALVWENSIEIEFGGEKVWTDNTFKCEWFKAKYPGVWGSKKKSGLYWFSCDREDIISIINCNTPIDFPKGGTKFSETSKNNISILRGNTNKSIDNEIVFYNGEASDVFSRIRSHFALNNDKTGALAIAKYDLQNINFKVRLFTIETNINNILQSEKDVIYRYIDSEVGRKSIEQYWRAEFGWPILCKE